MKVLLIHPPSWTPSMPHLATPMLAAYLRGQGVETAQRDLNVEVMDRVLTRGHLERALRHVRRRYAGRQGRRHAADRGPAREAVDWALSSGERLAETVEDAKTVLRGPAFWDGPRGRDAFTTVMGALQLASLPYFPAMLDLSTYHSGVPEDRSVAVLQAARDPRLNVFHEVLEPGLIRSLLDEGPDLVGISIPTMAQVIAGVTVAHLLRAHGFEGHITVGGPHVTMLREQIARTPALFEAIDSAVVFDGERPLLELADALAGDGDLSRVPGLIYPDGDTIRTTPVADPVPMDELPPPDFSGLALGQYLIPEPVLPMIGSRGCYHGRCAFCSVGYGGDRRYRQMSPERVVEHMLAVHERTGARHIWFADEAITPRSFRGMARLLEEAGAPLHWAGYGRLDRPITAELLEALVRGGCRMLFYGLETASPRIVERMHKGTTVETMGRVLRDGAAAGIWNHVFFFFGFPGETMADAQETVNFLYAHQDAVHSAAFGTFMLERHSAVHRNPSAYGVSEVLEDPRRDLAIVFDYRVRDGLDEAMAERVSAHLMASLPTKPYPQYYVHDTYRFLYATRHYDQGRPYPTWLGGQVVGRLP